MPRRLYRTTLKELTKMRRLALGLMLVAPLLAIQACSTADAPARKAFRKVSISVDGMAEHNGVL